LPSRLVDVASVVAEQGLAARDGAVVLALGHERQSADLDRAEGVAGNPVAELACVDFGDGRLARHFGGAVGVGARVVGRGAEADEGEGGDGEFEVVRAGHPGLADDAFLAELAVGEGGGFAAEFLGEGGFHFGDELVESGGVDLVRAVAPREEHHLQSPHRTSAGPEPQEAFRDGEVVEGLADGAGARHVRIRRPLEAHGFDLFGGGGGEAVEVGFGAEQAFQTFRRGGGREEKKAKQAAHGMPLYRRLRSQPNVFFTTDVHR